MAAISVDTMIDSDNCRIEVDQSVQNMDWYLVLSFQVAKMQFSIRHQ